MLDFVTAGDALKMQKKCALSAFVVAVFLGIWLPGCGGEKTPGLGQVTGTITMDGKPLPDATLTFETSKGGLSAALGRTDANGKYELYYSRGHKGATTGENIVRITTLGETGGEDNSQVRRESVPTKYNTSSELKADIKRGSNVVNFDLKSGGEIYQPGETPKGKKVRSATGCL